MSVATQMLLNQVALFAPRSPRPHTWMPSLSKSSVHYSTPLIPPGTYAFGWNDPRKVYK